MDLRPYADGLKQKFLWEALGALCSAATATGIAVLLSSLFEFHLLEWVFSFWIVGIVAAVGNGRRFYLEEVYEWVRAGAVFSRKQSFWDGVISWHICATLWIIFWVYWSI